MSQPLVVIDADVLGRQRTGDETYVENLLRELVPLAERPAPRRGHARRGAVPDGIEPVELPATSQVVAHGGRGCRACSAACARRSRTSSTWCRPSTAAAPVVTVQDLSFERDRG